jgi:hypothetical protein
VTRDSNDNPVLPLEESDRRPNDTVLQTEAAIPPAPGESLVPVFPGKRRRIFDSTLIDRYEGLITAKLCDSVRSFYEAGRCLVEAEATMTLYARQEIARRLKRRGINKTKLCMLRKIGKKELFAEDEFQDLLPAHVAVLYQLTGIADAKLKELIRGGVLHSGTTRDEAHAVKKEALGKTVKSVDGAARLKVVPPRGKAGQARRDAKEQQITNLEDDVRGLSEHVTLQPAATPFFEHEVGEAGQPGCGHFVAHLTVTIAGEPALVSHIKSDVEHAIADVRQRHPDAQVTMSEVL